MIFMVYVTICCCTWLDAFLNKKQRSWGGIPPPAAFRFAMCHWVRWKIRLDWCFSLVNKHLLHSLRMHISPLSESLWGWVKSRCKSYIFREYASITESHLFEEAKHLGHVCHSYVRNYNLLPSIHIYSSHLGCRHPTQPPWLDKVGTAQVDMTVLSQSTRAPVTADDSSKQVAEWNKNIYAYVYQCISMYTSMYRTRP